MNYSIQEYTNDIISAIVDVCDKNGLKHPNVITESGRSLTAHHSVLVFEALETTSLPQWNDEEEVGEDEHELLRDLYQIWDRPNDNRIIENWHDAIDTRNEALNRFNLGQLDLKTRARIESLFWSIAREIGETATRMKHAPTELKDIVKMLPDKYFCNFSLFQSLPDSWAVDQLFPTMPIDRLDERPTRNATIQDITCDSDGKIAYFISPYGSPSASLPVHSLKKNEPYYIGVFLVGAYQEILGDMHNLFGDTNAVHINVGKEKKEIEIIIGEKVAEVLDYVDYDPNKLVRNVEKWVNTSVKSGKISVEEGREFLSNYCSGLYGYTYLEKR